MSDPTRISAEQNIVIDVVGDIIQGMEKSNNTSSDSAERPNIVNKSGKSSKTSASSNSKSGKSSEHESNKKQQKTDQIGAGPSTSSSKSLRHGSSKSDQKARSNQKHEKSSSKDKGKPSSSNDLTDIKNQLSVLTRAIAQVTPIIPMVKELKTAGKLKKNFRNLRPMLITKVVLREKSLMMILRSLKQRKRKQTIWWPKWPQPETEVH